MICATAPVDFQWRISVAQSHTQHDTLAPLEHTPFRGCFSGAVAQIDGLLAQRFSGAEGEEIQWRKSPTKAANEKRVENDPPGVGQIVRKSFKAISGDEPHVVQQPESLLHMGAGHRLARPSWRPRPEIRPRPPRARGSYASPDAPERALSGSGAMGVAGKRCTPMARVLRGVSAPGLDTGDIKLASLSYTGAPRGEMESPLRGAKAQTPAPCGAGVYEVETRGRV